MIGAHLDHLGLQPRTDAGRPRQRLGRRRAAGRGRGGVEAPNIPLKRTLVFILFGAEEQGVKGSGVLRRAPGRAQREGDRVHQSRERRPRRTYQRRVGQEPPADLRSAGTRQHPVRPPHDDRLGQQQSGAAPAGRRALPVGRHPDGVHRRRRRTARCRTRVTTRRRIAGRSSRRKPWKTSRESCSWSTRGTGERGRTGRLAYNRHGSMHPTTIRRTAGHRAPRHRGCGVCRACSWRTARRCRSSTRRFGPALSKFVSRQKRLRAIVVLSAHWQTTGGIRITSSPQPQLIYDFMGFPSWVYQLTYACPGDRSVAQAVAILLERQGIAARLDPDRGLDHGVWVPLSLAVPDATTPVVQVSLPLPSDPETLLAIGRALAPLRSEDILLVGTGGIVHNLARVEMDTPDGIVGTVGARVRPWTHDRAAELNTTALVDYQRLAPHAARRCPRRNTSTRCWSSWASALPERFGVRLCTMGSATGRCRCARSRWWDDGGKTGDSRSGRGAWGCGVRGKG